MTKKIYQGEINNIKDAISQNILCDNSEILDFDNMNNFSNKKNAQDSITRIDNIDRDDSPKIPRFSEDGFKKTFDGLEDGHIFLVINKSFLHIIFRIMHSSV